MFGRSANRALLFFALALALAPTPAFARMQNFATGSPFGVGFNAGLENRPRSSFAAGTQTTTSNYSNYFGFQPFFDFQNLNLRLHAGWHFYPLLSGAGSDSKGSFTESSDAGSFEYGVRLMLCPMIFAQARSRAYFVGGLYNSIVKLRNSRKYTSGSLIDQTNTERLQGSGLELSGGVGFEFFLIQNYSLSMEFGYTDRSIESFQYKTTTDSSGTARKENETALDSNGHKKGFHAWTPYFQIGLNLNL